jgi:hypothetical protein
MRHPFIPAALATACVTLFACAGDSGPTTSSDTATSTSTSTATSTSTDTSTNTNTDTDTNTDTSTDTSTSGASNTTEGSESTTTASATTDTTSATDTTGAGESCRDNQFLGNGIAADGWGLGAFCDRVSICAAPDQQAAIQAAAPAFQCALSPGEQFSCPQGQIECGPPGQAMIDDALYAQLCAALALPGLDAAYCLVLGP